jgi:hypothetical protein
MQPYEHVDRYKIGSSLQSLKMVQPRTKEVWEGVFLIPHEGIVPSTSDLLTGGIIQVAYYLELESNLSFLSGDYRLPVTIGVVPFVRTENDASQYQPPESITDILLRMKTS